MHRDGCYPKCFRAGSDSHAPLSEPGAVATGLLPSRQATLKRAAPCRVRFFRIELTYQEHPVATAPGSDIAPCVDFLTFCAKPITTATRQPVISVSTTDRERLHLVKEYLSCVTHGLNRSASSCMNPLGFLWAAASDGFEIASINPALVQRVWIFFFSPLR